MKLIQRLHSASKSQLKIWQICDSMPASPKDCRIAQKANPIASVPLQAEPQVTCLMKGANAMSSSGGMRLNQPDERLRRKLESMSSDWPSPLNRESFDKQ